MFTFTVLAPPNSPTSKIRACLLTFDQTVHILADPGWDGKSDISYLDPVINSIDLILLSHPTTDYIGSFALLYLKYPILSTIPIYSTLPIANLGRVATLDMYRSLGLVGPLKDAPYIADDIEEAFDKLILLKHNQTTTLNGKFNGMTLTPYNAGHTLGGTFWSINNNLERVVYASSWNHSKDSFLNGANFLQQNGAPLPQLLRPTCIITNTDIGSSLSHKKRIEKFYHWVDATLANGGSVLLPTSLAGRFLELLHLVDEHLQSAPIPVLLLAHTGTRILSYASSMLEWMAPQVIKDWESRNTVPFDASRVQLVEPQELMQMTGPKVVFCADSAVTMGSMAEAAIMSLCADQKTTIIMTEKNLENSVGNFLFKQWEYLATQRNGVVEDGVAVPFISSLTLHSIREEPLVNKELELYTEMVEGKMSVKKTKKNREQKNKNLLKEDGGNILDGDSSDESSDDEDDQEAAENNDLTKKKDFAELNQPLDVDVRLARGRNRMFPYIPKRVKHDDYGEIIKPADFAKVEEKLEIDRDGDYNGGDGNPHLGEKRKWDGDDFKEKVIEINQLDPMTNPRKRFVTGLDVKTRCGMTFIDLAGLIDLRSMGVIIPLLKPKNVILMKDFTDERNLQMVYNQLNKVRGGVNYELTAIEDNTPIQIGDILTSYEISLDEELNSKLKWQDIAGGYSIAHVIGEVKAKVIDETDVKPEAIVGVEKAVEGPEEVMEGVEKTNGDVNGDVKIEVEVAIVKNEESMGDNVKPEENGVVAIVETNGEIITNEVDPKNFVLASLKESSLTNIRSTPLAIGDIRLSELKKRLSNKGHLAEFRGEGTLVINNLIAIRKITDGDVIVDGSPSRLFYEVRDCVRDMLAYV